MGLKIFLINFKRVIISLFLGFTMVFTGCAFSVFKTTPGESRQTQPQPKEGGETAEKSGLNPRDVAALQLTEQGQTFLKSQRPDDAIRILERALNLNPDNGRNYYYLAEAWLMKGNIGQAEQFNRLAEIYLKDDVEWLQKVILQKKRIAEKGHE